MPGAISTGFMIFTSSLKIIKTTNGDYRVEMQQLTEACFALKTFYTSCRSTKIKHHETDKEKIRFLTGQSADVCILVLHEDGDTELYDHHDETNCRTHKVVGLEKDVLKIVNFSL